MFKFYKRYKMLEQTRLKYEKFQHLLGKVLNIKNCIEMHNLEIEISRDNTIHYNDYKKLMRLCQVKRVEIRSKDAEKN